MDPIPNENLMSTPAGYATPAQIQQMYDYAKYLGQGNAQFPTVTKWTQGVSNIIGALMGGSLARQADLLQQQSLQKYKGATAGTLPDAPAPTNSNSFSAPLTDGATRKGADNNSRSGGLDAERNAISGIESGGKYNEVGPATKTGDRAYGRYQVMGQNIPQWTREALGRSMTPEEFLRSPQAQDAVFNQKFGQYKDKYGPEGAARAWFAGEGGMNNPNARDVLGTTVQNYSDRFMRGMPTNATAFQGAQENPASRAAAITALALRGGGPTAPPNPNYVPSARNAPVGGGGQQYIPPNMIPPVARPTKEQAVELMTNPLFGSPAAAARAEQAYQGQFQPIAVPWTGGTVLVNPQNPGQQVFRPDIMKVPVDVQGGAGTGIKTEVPATVSPGAGGGLNFNYIPQGGPPGGAPQGAPGVAVPPAPPSGMEGLPNLLHYAPDDKAATSQVAPAQAALPQGGPPTPPQGLPPFAQNPQAQPPTSGPQMAQVLPPQLYGEMGKMRDFALDTERQKQQIDKSTEQFAKAYDARRQGSEIAIRSLPQIAMAKKLIEDPKFISGFLADPRLDWAKAKALMAPYLGTDPNAAAATEFFDKVMSGNILEDMKVMLQGLGQVRVAEINLLSKATGNRYNTLPANRAVLDIMQRTHQLAGTLGQMSSAYAQGVRWDPKTGQPYQAYNRPTGLDYGWDQTMQQYMKNHPLFNDKEIENYNKLLDPKGAVPSEASVKYGGEAGIEKTLEQAAHGGAPETKPGATPDISDTKTLGGKTYVKSGGQWYEQPAR